MMSLKGYVTIYKVHPSLNNKSGFFDSVCTLRYNINYNGHF